ncbi:unnamed protein product [Vicia faba]|uniref:Uncharacterized protein n=1 Tax=Vicia faba TaxID=3906 RepID=A0AAV1ABG7_VICFA|nr:unnamed protein product [Vicia faba]
MIIVSVLSCEPSLDGIQELAGVKPNQQLVKLCLRLFEFVTSITYIKLEKPESYQEKEPGYIGSSINLRRKAISELVLSFMNGKWLGLLVRFCLQFSKLYWCFKYRLHLNQLHSLIYFHLVLLWLLHPVFQTQALSITGSDISTIHKYQKLCKFSMCCLIADMNSNLSYKIILLAAAEICQLIMMMHNCNLEKHTSY